MNNGEAHEAIGSLERIQNFGGGHNGKMVRRKRKARYLMATGSDQVVRWSAELVDDTTFFFFDDEIWSWRIAFEFERGAHLLV